MHEKYVELKNFVKVQRAYRTKYERRKAPAVSKIKNMIQNLQKTVWIVPKSVTSKKRTVRTDDLIKSIKNMLIEDPTTSLRKIANIVPASIGTIRYVARTDLKLKAYKKNRSFKLLKTDRSKRLKFVKFLKSRHLNVEEYFICSDEAYFYLHGGHNVQKDQILAIFQPD